METYTFRRRPDDQGPRDGLEVGFYAPSGEFVTLYRPLTVGAAWDRLAVLNTSHGSRGAR